jgi:endonuclease YncB( thermonuclease family)
LMNILSQLFRPFRFWFTSFRKESSALSKGIWLIVGMVALCIFCSMCSLILAPNTDTVENTELDRVEAVTVAPDTPVLLSDDKPPFTAPGTTNPASATVRPSVTFRATEVARPDTSPTETPNTIPTNAPAPGKPPPSTVPSTPTSLPTSPPAPRSVGAALVTAITDGDTVTVEMDGTSYTVRYIGMDTPERGDPFYAEATQANSDLVLGREVWLEKDVNETDRFGRLLRYVYVGDVMINEELVRTGYAQASAYPPDVKYQERLDRAERLARENNAGLWAIAVIVPTAPPAAPTPLPEAPQASAPPTGVAAPPPAPSGSGLVIIRVNKSDEYVDLRNDSGAALDLAGWTLRSERGSQDCALSGVIGAGEVLRIWAMSGAPGYVCGFGSNIWNNSENDDAVLINPQGQEAYRYDSLYSYVGCRSSLS